MAISKMKEILHTDMSYLVVQKKIDGKVWFLVLQNKNLFC